MKAIIYTSNSGFTRKYAEMLSAETNLPVYALKSANKNIKKGDEIIYLGWLMAGFVKGLNKALKFYDVNVVCAVGMGAPNNETVKETIQRHKLENKKVFYLQGGFDINKLHGIYKFMMKAMGNMQVKNIEAKTEKTEEDKKMLDLFLHGGDFVSLETLQPVINWIKTNK